MRQVPTVLLIGNGRLAKHLIFYFQGFSYRILTWSRQTGFPVLPSLIQKATHVILAISDDAIPNFIDTYLPDSDKIYIHCSGCFYHPRVYGAHPLMTFTHDLLTVSQYETIPFILDEEAPSFEILFPALPNPHYRIAKKDKALYHSLAVLGGNFTALLWKKVFHLLEAQCALPPEIYQPYIKIIFQNIIENKIQLTGPLVREDQKTLEMNRQALAGDPYQKVFDAFVEAYTEEKKR